MDVNSVRTEYQNSLNFLTLNVCGLNSKYKYKNFHDIVGRNKYHFICLSEIRTDYIAPDEFQ